MWLAAMLVTEGAARGGDDGGLDGGSLVAAKVAVMAGGGLSLYRSRALYTLYRGFVLPSPACALSGGPLPW